MNTALATEPGVTAAPAYETPTITVMSDEEVLRAFQMTASQIGAAATWWLASCVSC
jgi:hypothetical protein